MKIILWLSLCGILYTYICYPLMMWMLAKLRPRPWIAAPATPSVSIVLAVHNGAALLPFKIQHLLDLDYPNIQDIIVVSDGSTDGTAEWLTSEIPFYELRHMIRPGITGWAQVRYQYGASLEETKQKLEYDLYYIKHLSLGLDLLIMFETIKTIILRRGAQ